MEPDSRPANPDPAWGHDRYVSGEVLQAALGQKSLHQSLEGANPILHGSQQDDAGMRSGRIMADVAESLVRGDEETFFPERSSPKLWVLCPSHVLFSDRLGVVTGVPEQRRHRSRKVLVNLDLHGPP